MDAYGRSHAEANRATDAFFPRVPNTFLQRKCACGGSVGLTGACSQCESEKLIGKPLQGKWRVGEAADEYEREADRVAEQVMETAEPNRRSEPSRPAGPAKIMQRTSGQGGAESMEAALLVSEVLSSAGEPLDAATQRFFATRFGHDFGSVRVHADAAAAQSARSINALAYTVGQHVVFGAGQYAPGSRAGQRLLAHELTHVVQQGGNMPRVPGSAAADVPQPAHPTDSGLIQRQPQPEPESKLRDLPLFLKKLELDVGKNLLDYGHHLYQAAALHPDEPKVLQDAFSRYALGLNVLKTGFRYAGFKSDTADKLALGTGLLFKSLTFVREGELVVDFQVDIGRGVKFETNFNLSVNPKDATEVRKAGVNFGFVRRF